MAADLNVNNYHIKNVATPLTTLDGANKGYTDTKISRAGTNDALGVGAGTFTGPIKTNEATPNTDNTYWLGTSTNRYSNVWTVNFQVDGILKLNGTAQSVNTTSGTLIIAGGVGIGKSLFADQVYDNGSRVIQQVVAGTGISGGGNGPSVVLSNTGVLSLTGTGSLGVSASTGAITLTNLGVTSLSGTTALGVSASTGSITLTNLGVTSITNGTGVSVTAGTGDITVSIGQSVGTTDTPTFAGISKSGTTGNGDIGQTGNRFGTVWATTFSGTAVQAQYADLAEKYMPDREYEPGTVLVFGGEKEVTLANTFMDTRIAGVVSTNPAYMMNSELDGGVYVALTGRVPCKVTGKIRKGDMLVAAGGLGVATASDNPKMGSVIGKALENYDSHDIGIIEVVVGRI
jgi:hypothetical protein